MAKASVVSQGAWTLTRSGLVGAPAHYEHLQQLLDAPDPYWKAQTPVGFRPVTRAVFDAARAHFSEFSVDPRAGLPQIVTLCVLMAARMPGISLELRVNPPAALAVNSPADVAAVRLVRGKLELGRSASVPPGGVAGDLTWQAPPHHSTLIGKK